MTGIEIAVVAGIVGALGRRRAVNAYNAQQVYRLEAKTHLEIERTIQDARLKMLTASQGKPTESWMSW